MTNNTFDAADFIAYLNEKARAKTPKPKQSPDFYVFEDLGTDQPDNKLVGCTFSHKRGKGFTILIDGKRYVAFPPKGKTKSTE
jgi:hypothetical protein